MLFCARLSYRKTSFRIYIYKGVGWDNLHNINPSECMTDVGFQEFRDIGLQPVGLDLETKGSNDYVDGINARSIILELGRDETITYAPGEPCP